MTLKTINFILMFFFTNLLLYISLSVGLAAPALDESIGTISNMVYCPSSYHLTYELHSFKSFSSGTDFHNTFPSSNTSCKDGRCGTKNFITYWYGSTIMIVFSTFLTISNICFIMHLIWMNRYKPDSIKGKQYNSDVPHNQKNECTLSSIVNHVKIFTISDLDKFTFGSLQEGLITKGEHNIFYKGLYGSREVAIKCSTERDCKYELAFQIELNTLTEVRHDNLTSLIGYCTENDERLLIFEYMNNGTLYDQLFNTNFQANSLFHTWKLRIKILLDCARGIECLHKHADRGIIHRDITTSNILLDENWNAQISNLGLALVGPEPGTERVDVDGPVGTIGYRDPDCNAATRSVTLKYDVYSFGVVMIQIITANCAYDHDQDMIYADYIAPKIIAGKLPIYIDRRPNFPVGVDARAVRLIGQLSERCIRRSTILRPTMSEVVQEIERVISFYD